MGRLSVNYCPNSIEKSLWTLGQKSGRGEAFLLKM